MTGSCQGEAVRKTGGQDRGQEDRRTGGLEAFLQGDNDRTTYLAPREIRQ